MSSYFKIFIISSFVLLTFAYSYYHKNKMDKFFDSGLHQVVLKQMPEFSLDDVYKGRALNSIKVLEKTYKTIIFHFWGTWCAPCEAEFPSFVKYLTHYKNKNLLFVVVAINDELPKVKKYFKRYNFKGFEHLFLGIDNTGSFLAKFGVSKVPETFIFSGKGSTLKRFVGPQDWSKDYYYRYLDSFLD